MHTPALRILKGQLTSFRWSDLSGCLPLQTPRSVLTGKGGECTKTLAHWHQEYSSGQRKTLTNRTGVSVWILVQKSVQKRSNVKGVVRCATVHRNKFGVKQQKPFRVLLLVR